MVARSACAGVGDSWCGRVEPSGLLFFAALAFLPGLSRHADSPDSARHLWDEERRDLRCRELIAVHQLCREDAIDVFL